MPNFLVDAPGRDFPEDAWVGRVLRIGGLRMRVDQRDQCCVMVTIDPVTLRRDPAILRHSPGARQPARGLRLDRAAWARWRWATRSNSSPEPAGCYPYRMSKAASWEMMPRSWGR